MHDLVILQEGIRRTIDSFSHLTAGSQSKREGLSKASRILGGGKGMGIYINYCFSSHHIVSHIIRQHSLSFLKCINLFKICGIISTSARVSS